MIGWARFDFIRRKATIVANLHRRAMMTRLVAMFLALLLLSGCTRAISEAGRKLADPDITFSQLKEKPDSYMGKYVILGGLIATAKNTKEGALLEVVQFKLDNSGYPEDTLTSGGRFLATHPDFLDPMIYAPGRLVAILGEVKGKRVLPLDEVDYLYPVIAIREIHPWRSSSEYGLSPNPYPSPFYTPYYYGYDTGPTPFRPQGPPLYR